MASPRPYAKPARSRAAPSPRLGAGVWLWLALGGLLALATAAAASPPTRLPAAGETDPAAMAPYLGQWECRYGDSPLSKTGEPRLARPGASEGFVPCRPPGTPPGRQGNNFLWMRTVLGGADYPDPALFLLSMDQIFEAYLDGQLVYRFGELAEPARRHYAGHRPHYVPLGAGYQGKLLSLRIYSEHINIGIVGQVQLGSRLALTVATMRSGLTKLGIGVVLMLIGLLALAIYATQRKDSLYGAYGGFALASGTYIVLYSQTRTQELAHTLQWNYVELGALYVMVPCFLQFLFGLIGPGPLGITRHLVKLHLGYCGFAALCILTGLLPVMHTAVIFTFILLFDCAYVLAVVLVAAWRRHVEAQLLFAALALPVAFMVYDSLAALGLVARPTNIITPLAMLAFIAILAVIPIRRLLQLQKTRERAMKLEVESAVNQRRLAEQGALLDAAVRMASGDLETPIAVADQSPLRHLGRALEDMRRDLRDKFQQLQQSHAKVKSLNEELLRQIEQRSRRLLEALLGSERVPVATATTLAPGSTLGEVYQVVRNIGQGAMGAVYEVERTTDHLRLAAKVLSGDGDRTSLIRFAREAQLLAKLSHPNLIRIVDVDVSISGTLYLVMELVRGTTLRHLRPRYGDAPWALSILRQVAVALAAVHERGIVHRDLKPANILIAEAAPGLPPLVKLADFGISVVARDDKAEAAGKQAISPLVSLLTGEADAEEVSLSELSIEEPHGPAAAPRERDRRGSAPAAGPAGAARADDLTEAGMIVGTPMYMAPEISFGSRLAQPASDVFALGVIAYELLTKELPFRRPPVGTVLRQETLRIPLGLRALTHLDPLLLSLFERALSMDPAQRPSAAELAAALTVEPTTVISSLHGR